jgi:hypothetical protein
MQAVVCTKKADPNTPVTPNIRFATDWPEPAAPGPGQALIRLDTPATPERLLNAILAR